MSASVCSRRSRLDLGGPSSPSKRPYGSSPVGPETLTRRKSVCRALFVSPSESRADNYAKNKLMEMQLADSLRYNFDFDKEVPLEGRWKWKAVEPMPEARSESSAVPKTPRILSKTVIFTAPFAYTPEELMEMDKTPNIVQDLGPEPAPIIPGTQNSQSSQNDTEAAIDPARSQDRAEDIATSPHLPVVVPPALELPKASTSPLKREKSSTAVIKLKPKMKQQRLTNTYFKVTKRRVQAATGKGKPARPRRPAV